MSINLGSTLSPTPTPAQAATSAFLNMDAPPKIPPFAGGLMHKTLQHQHQLQLQLQHDAADTMGLDEILSLPWLEDTDAHLVRLFSLRRLLLRVCCRCCAEHVLEGASAPR